MRLFPSFTNESKDRMALLAPPFNVSAPVRGPYCMCHGEVYVAGMLVGEVFVAAKRQETFDPLEGSAIKFVGQVYVAGASQGQVDVDCECN